MELSQKFADFKHPKGFEEKIERIVHKLGDIENSLDDMTGIEAIFCSEALGEAKSLVKKLIAIEEDVNSLEKGKEQLIQRYFKSARVAYTTLVNAHYSANTHRCH
ncbi:hypothetical protein ANCDUO_20789, partial [Ancylostoma duodenale]